MDGLLPGLVQATRVSAGGASGTLAGMTSDQLTAAQAERLKRQVAARLRWLNKLCDRMHRLHFSTDDRLVLAARQARDRMKDLFMACHYATCERGVGRDEKGS